ncbi:MAG TPA: ferric aerobactin receptor [Cytophagales bacterium]|nr:ferric aerobactin receptor [Cytophagales bacterium]HAP58706.1 ferric aerobactin receptor [Cytophagales bacterium]
MKTFLAIAAYFILITTALGQNGMVRGRVFNQLNNETIPFANVVIQGTTKGAVTDLDGNFEITGLTPGEYNFEVSYVGFKKLVVFEVQVTNSRPAIIEFPLVEEVETLEGVEVVASPFYKPDESPVSLRSIGPNEIRRNPGGNRDISRVVRSLPGVASTASFRNDIIIRGGAPVENKYYLDGIEVPVINHFQTQGSSGGPVGLINVDFIQNVDFYSGAFPANRGNALSSIFDFRQKDGRDDKWTMNAIVGASDLGITLEGPVTDNSTLIVSTRRSYLQFLFQLLELPFLPIYNDYQLKYKVKFNQNNQLSIISLGALDLFDLNLEANETESQQFLLETLPVQDQWNYTIGAKYERFRDNGFTTLVVSRNMLNNRNFKYADNDDSSEDNLLSNYLSQEIENKFRAEDYFNFDGFKVTYGVNYEYAKYNVNTFQQIPTPFGTEERNFSSALDMHKWGVFGQVSKGFLGERLVLATGFRADGNNYSELMDNMLDQFSPRFSASYYFTPNLSLNFNTGIYYQLPSYTVLGFVESETEELANQDRVKYMQNRHLVGGVEYTFENTAKISVEGFYKRYYDYPFLLTDSISLANLGADFGVVGNDPIVSNSEGRTYGLEVLAQQKLTKGFYGLVAYTLVRSEFADKTGEFKPSAWDFRHVVSLTGGKKFAGDVEIGVRWLFAGGAPFTPIDVNTSLLVDNWNARPGGVLDFSQLNSERLPASHQLDFRIDKKWFFNKWTLDLYFDVQNLYNYQPAGPDLLAIQRDEDGVPLIETSLTEGASYVPRFIPSTAGQTILPTVGIIVEL